MNPEDAPEVALLLNRAVDGDIVAWGALLSLHRERLESIANFRLDPRLRGRVDAADVVQETFLAATERRDEFFGQSVQPLFLWLRWMVGNILLELHRHHLGVQKRDAKREVHFGAGGSNDTRTALLEQLTGGGTGPATVARRVEVQAQLNHALDQMDPTDREVLALRHYEQLTSAETALALGIQERAAAKRYTRALERLREMLAEMPGGLTGLRP